MPAEVWSLSPGRQEGGGASRLPATEHAGQGLRLNCGVRDFEGGGGPTAGFSRLGLYPECGVHGGEGPSASREHCHPPPWVATFPRRKGRRLLSERAAEELRSPEASTFGPWLRIGLCLSPPSGRCEELETAFAVPSEPLSSSWPRVSQHLKALFAPGPVVQSVAASTLYQKIVGLIPSRGLSGRKPRSVLLPLPLPCPLPP